MAIYGKTTAQFVEQSINVHGARYDYSRCNYKNQDTRVIVSCAIHGEFEVKPFHHLKGYGCPICAQNRRWTSSAFLKMAHKRYGDKFSYDIGDFVYKDIRLKVTCKDHGEFTDMPEDFLKYGACRSCRDEEWKERQKSEYESYIQNGDGTYDYSRASFLGMDVPVTIGCRHGSFEILPGDHVRDGRGCVACQFEHDPLAGIRKAFEILRYHGRVPYITRQQIISLIRSITSGIYEFPYEKIEYVGAELSVGGRFNIVATCSIHGHFLCRVSEHFLLYEDAFEYHNHHVWADAHVSVRGCPKCIETIEAKKALARKNNERRRDRNHFLVSAKERHGESYDYSAVRWKGNDTPVKVLCSRHGVFAVTPKEHVNGRGCPSCSESSGERMVAAWLSANNLEFEKQKVFAGCRYKSPLRFDFYLPNHNTVIEYHGRQHYEPVEYFGGHETFKEQITRDNIKSKYCDRNNIRLVVIPFSEKSIGQFLFDELRDLPNVNPTIQLHLFDITEG